MVDFNVSEPQTIVLDAKQRKFKRFPVNIKIDYRVLKQGDSTIRRSPGILLKYMAQDCEEGMFLSTPYSYTIGTIFELSIKIPRQKSKMHVLAEAVWLTSNSEEPGLGLTLYKTTKADMENIVRNSKRGVWYSSQEQKINTTSLRTIFKSSTLFALSGISEDSEKKEVTKIQGSLTYYYIDG